MINANHPNLIKQQINDLRKKLDKLLESEELINSEKALELSKDLDNLINKYVKAISSL